MTEDYYQLVKTAAKYGNVGEVNTKLYRWRADTSAAGPSTDQIDSSVPQAARDDGQPQILEYLLSLGGRTGAYAIAHTRSPLIFQTLTVYTAFKWANEEAKAWLLEHGAVPEARNQLGETDNGPERWMRRRRAQVRRSRAEEADEEAG
ncbi:hypothetical protein XANCAGTX0491_006560 [Xanthoria calcicola]